MKSMFSGVRNRTVPKKFEDCIAKDEMASNLWKWASRLEQWGLVLTILLIFYGVCISIDQAQVVENITSGYGGIYSDSSFHFGLFMLSLMKWGFYTFIVYCTYHILALLVGSLASIVENTRIAANIAMYKENDNTSNDRVGSAYHSETVLERTAQKQDAKEVEKLLDKLYELE